MKKITGSKIQIAFEVSKKYHDRGINRADAISILKKAGMNVGSAGIYLHVFQHLKNGDAFKRTLNAESFDYFLNGILNYYGMDQLSISLRALKDHIDYYESYHSGKLHLVRELYQKYFKMQLKIEDPIIDEDEELTFPEGRERYQLHRSKERSTTLIKLAKANYLKINKRLSCQVCDFSFREHYGDFGNGFIEAHHVYPISKLTEETPTRVEDIALVCSNCHRIIHRHRPWLNINELYQIKRKTNTNNFGILPALTVHSGKVSDQDG